jgi:hypothetical protein
VRFLTYLAANHGAAWSDEMLVGLDRRLGFDWAAWFEFVDRHLVVKLALAIASLMPQILLSVIYFSWRGWDDRNREFRGEGHAGVPNSRCARRLAILVGFQFVGPAK